MGLPHGFPPNAVGGIPRWYHTPLTSPLPPSEKPLLHSGKLLLAFWLAGAAGVGGVRLAYRARDE
jgi:hypothetical protein